MCWAKERVRSLSFKRVVITLCDSHWLVRRETLRSTWVGYSLVHFLSLIERLRDCREQQQQQRRRRRKQERKSEGSIRLGEESSVLAIALVESIGESMRPIIEWREGASIIATKQRERERERERWMTGSMWFSRVTNYLWYMTAEKLCGWLEKNRIHMC